MLWETIRFRSTSGARTTRSSAATIRVNTAARNRELASRATILSAIVAAAAITGATASRTARRNPRLGSLPLQLGEYSGDISHTPMLGDMPINDPKNVAGGEHQAFAGRLDAVIDALVRPLVNEARRDAVIRGDGR